MTIHSVFIGGIGTLFETSELQFEAFNKSFVLNDIDFQWSYDEYVQTLSSSGGVDRLQAISADHSLNLNADKIQKLHADKTSLFNAALSESRLSPREGVQAFFEQAKRKSISVIWATTTLQKNIDAIFDATDEHFQPELFTLITNKAFVTEQKPSPEVYNKIIAQLDIKLEGAIAVEDSPSGEQSARAAGITTLVFPGEFTSHLEFAPSTPKVQTLVDILDVS